MKNLFTIAGIAACTLLVACVEQQSQHAQTKPGQAAEQTSYHPPTQPVTLEESVATAQMPYSNKELLRTGGYAAAQRVAIAADVYTPPVAAYPEMNYDGENYQEIAVNPVKIASQEPVSTISVDVDTAGYANVRRMLNNEGRMPPKNAVRIEEMINYFGYNYPAPSPSGHPFSVSTEIGTAPWNSNLKLLQIGIKGYSPEPEQRPAANLVFLVDVSGSMQSPNKLALVKRSLRLLVQQMNERDRIALAVYAGAAGTVLESTPASEKRKILRAIDSLEAGGSTHGSAGIKLAYELAQDHFIENGINRVIIASDGDMNVGTVDIDALKTLVAKKSKSGIALTTLGFGSGNYNDALMEQIADIGNGNAAYIDSIKEAKKVLVKEMQSTVHTIAADVKIQIEFNPEVVAQYRLIGYENRLLKREDFNNDKVDAGEIGAGHTVTALYEIALSDSAGYHIDPLRYGKTEPVRADHSDELAFVKLRYKRPGESSSTLISQAVKAQSEKGENNSDNWRFAASVAGFGQLLRDSQYTQDWSYDDAAALARGARGDDPEGYRSEFIHLIEIAQSLSLEG